MKRPALLQYIAHNEPAFGRAHTGLVAYLLDAQFVYMPKTGNDTRFCLYNEQWSETSMVKKADPASIKAPSVWRDHGSRTCIVTEVDGDTVHFIPSTDEVFEVKTAKRSDFVSRLFLEPIDYPVERAARLFAEFARNMGASNKVLKVLAEYTQLTDEELEMATKKAAAAKDAAAKKPPAKAVKEGKTTTAPKAKAEKASGPRENMSTMFRDLLTKGGLTDAQILKQVSAKYPNAKPGYAAFYRKQLLDKGVKVPAVKDNEPAQKAGRPAKPKAKVAK
jgi:hypothetical protein